MKEQITGVTENENDKKVEITHEEHESEEYITLANINIVSEMNSSHTKSTETEEPEDVRTNEQNQLARRVQFALTQINKQLVMSIHKTQAHVMLTQFNIKYGLKSFGNKEDKAMRKVLKQLHT